MGVEFVTGWVTGVLNYTGTIWNDLNLAIALIIGVPLAFWVIAKVVAMIKEREK